MNKSLSLRTFRLFVMAFALCLAATGNETAAQTKAKITLKMENVRLEEVITAIEQQSRYLFLNNQVDLNINASIDVKDEPIEQTLDKLFKDLDIDWKISGTNIYISEKQSAGGG